MGIFAEIVSGAVSNVAVAAASSDLPAGTWVEIDALNPVPGIGWTYASGAFTAPTVTPPAVTPQSAYAAFLAAGAIVTSTGTPALNGTYAIDAETQISITTEAAFINAFSEFSNGTTTNFPWQLANGTKVVQFPNTTAFMNFTKAIATLVTTAKLSMNAGLTTMPSNAVTIP